MVIPRPIDGVFRRLKTKISAVLLLIIIVIPFIRLGGQPIILLDIPARKFHILGLTIWPQELYFLHVILLILGLMLFFFTAMFGRIWCGFACPQTIFNELYDRIGRLVGGVGYGKPRKHAGVWLRVFPAWIVLSFLLSFVYVSYFVPFETLFTNLIHGRIFAAPPGAGFASWFYFFMGLTIFSLVNAAYFRENVCRLVCPYGRFQTALLDGHSPVVSYHTGRGEPRRVKKEKPGESAGDCIDCSLCTLVCPTGIDIRDGLQVGCLACGLCVDACTQVMGKFKKETLIDFRTIEQAKDSSAPRHYLRPRTLVYGTALAVLIGVFFYLLNARVPIYVSAVRDRTIYNIHIPGAGYQNGYEVKIGNMSDSVLRVRIRVRSDKRLQFLNPREFYEVPPGGLEQLRFILRYEDAGPRKFRPAIPLEFEVRDLKHGNFVKRVKNVFTFPSS